MSVNACSARARRMKDRAGWFCWSSALSLTLMSCHGFTWAGGAANEEKLPRLCPASEKGSQQKTAALAMQFTKPFQTHTQRSGVCFGAAKHQLLTQLRTFLLQLKVEKVSSFKHLYCKAKSEMTLKEPKNKGFKHIRYSK